MLEENPELAEHFVDIVPETLDALTDAGADLTRLINGTWQCGPPTAPTSSPQPSTS